MKKKRKIPTGILGKFVISAYVPTQHTFWIVYFSIIKWIIEESQKLVTNVYIPFHNSNSVISYKSCLLTNLLKENKLIKNQKYFKLNC